jgi:hypothetical protein
MKALALLVLNLLTRNVYAALKQSPIKDVWMRLPHVEASVRRRWHAAISVRKSAILMRQMNAIRSVLRKESTVSIDARSNAME